MTISTSAYRTRGTPEEYEGMKAAQEKEPPEIRRAMKMVDEALTGLRTEIQRLESKLEGVLFPSPPPEKACAAPPPVVNFGTPLGTSLNEFRNTIDNAHVYVSILISRLGV